MNVKRTLAGLVGLWLLATGCNNDVSGPKMEATGPIAFVSERDGNAEIYVMNADGSNPTRLTNNPAADVDPASSPDGTKIAFASNRDGDYTIYVMNADGSNPRRLTAGRAPAWSPDGKKIAFTVDVGAGVEGELSYVYSMNAEIGRASCRERV